MRGHVFASVYRLQMPRQGHVDVIGGPLIAAIHPDRAAESDLAEGNRADVADALGERKLSGITEHGNVLLWIQGRATQFDGFVKRCRRLPRVLVGNVVQLVWCHWPSRDAASV